jgi:hypothetical protein
MDIHEHRFVDECVNTGHKNGMVFTGESLINKCPILARIEDLVVVTKRVNSNRNTNKPDRCKTSISPFRFVVFDEFFAVMISESHMPLHQPHARRIPARSLSGEVELPSRWW